MVLIASEFSTSAEFREILQKYQNSAAERKFRGSARNSAARGTLGALLIITVPVSADIDRGAGQVMVC